MTPLMDPIKNEDLFESTKFNIMKRCERIYQDLNYALQNEKDEQKKKDALNRLDILKENYGFLQESSSYKHIHDFMEKLDIATIISMSRTQYLHDQKLGSSIVKCMPLKALMGELIQSYNARITHGPMDNEKIIFTELASRSNTSDSMLSDQGLDELQNFLSLVGIHERSKLEIILLDEDGSFSKEIEKNIDSLPVISSAFEKLMQDDVPAKGLQDRLMYERNRNNPDIENHGSIQSSKDYKENIRYHESKLREQREIESKERRAENERKWRAKETKKITKQHRA